MPFSKNMFLSWVHFLAQDSLRVKSSSNSSKTCTKQAKIDRFKNPILKRKCHTKRSFINIQRSLCRHSIQFQEVVLNFETQSLPKTFQFSFQTNFKSWIQIRYTVQCKSWYRKMCLYKIGDRRKSSCVNKNSMSRYKMKWMTWACNLQWDQIGSSFQLRLSR